MLTVFKINSTYGELNAHQALCKTYIITEGGKVSKFTGTKTSKNVSLYSISVMPELLFWTVQ